MRNISAYLSLGAASGLLAACCWLVAIMRTCTPLPCRSSYGAMRDYDPLKACIECECECEYRIHSYTRADRHRNNVKDMCRVSGENGGRGGGGMNAATGPPIVGCTDIAQQRPFNDTIMLRRLCAVALRSVRQNTHTHTLQTIEM